MKNFRLITAVFFLMVFSYCTQQFEKKVEKSKNNNPQVSLLGVFHFAGSTSDVASVQVDSILGNRRQEEIDQVLQKLESYQPDKILVEYPFSKNEKLNEEYKKYLDGKKELTENETHQLGFKLGKRLGHNELYAADYSLNLPFGNLQKFAEAHGKTDMMDKFIRDLQAKANKESKYLEQNTILDYLTRLNTDSSDLWNKNLYLGTMLEMGKDTAYPGAELAGQWYKRNMYILANIDRIAGSNDRILLIMGSGHRAILKQFVKDKNDFNYVEIHDYLVEE